jgi:hypothetical protein
VVNLSNGPACGHAAGVGAPGTSSRQKYEISPEFKRALPIGGEVLSTTTVALSAATCGRQAPEVDEPFNIGGRAFQIEPGNPAHSASIVALVTAGSTRLH